MGACRAIVQQAALFGVVPEHISDHADSFSLGMQSLPTAASMRLRVLCVEAVSVLPKSVGLLLQPLDPLGRPAFTSSLLHRAIQRLAFLAQYLLLRPLCCTPLTSGIFLTPRCN